jgi:hypothetical protein
MQLLREVVGRRLTYVSALGLPVQNYRSVKVVVGDDACDSTGRPSVFAAQNEPFLDTLVTILSGGANQIATALGLG